VTLKYDHLVGLAFTGIGQRDCFELASDFFDDNFGIKLPKLARPHDWRSNDHDLIRECYAKTGFEMITQWKATDLRPGDVLAIMIGESNPNHLAIVVDDGQILHHLMNQMSRVDPLRDFWLNQTAFVLRHPDVPDLRPSFPDVDIGDILRERNAATGR
jgi:cell wall-associated NlpC family hydrolase